MHGCLCSGTEWNCEIHEVWILRRPLICLSTAHRPADDSMEVFDSEVLCDKLILGSHIVIE